MKKPRILFVLHIPPPVNGASMVGEFIRQSSLIHESFQAQFINLASSNKLQEIGKGGLYKILKILKLYITVLNQLITQRPDLCYMTLNAHGTGFYKDFIIVLLLKLFKVRLVYHFHNKGVLKNSTKWYYDLCYRVTFKDTYCILLAKSLYVDIEKYIPLTNVYFCPNGIPVYSKNQKRESIKFPEDGCHFLFLSNMMKEKGVFELLEACYILKQRGINFHCHFIGAWSDITSESFEEKVLSLNLENEVKMHGKKYGTEKEIYFQESHVFVFPSFYHNECFPLVILEAMQFGLPVISTYEGAIPEMIIHGKSGLLVSKQNKMELAAAMERLATNKELRLKMGELAKLTYYKHYTLIEFEQNLNNILKEIA